MQDGRYAQRIAELAAQLGVPADYAQSRSLPLQPEAAELVPVGVSPEGRKIELSPKGARAWEQMRAAAARDGIELQPLSGFRSVGRQAEIIRGKLAGGRTIAEILTVLAAPGYSEHHTGLALDIGSPGAPPLEEGFGDSPAFRWLELRAGSFGFRLSFPRENPHQIAYEPWHWYNFI